MKDNNIKNMAYISSPKYSPMHFSPGHSLNNSPVRSMHSHQSPTHSLMSGDMLSNNNKITGNQAKKIGHQVAQPKEQSLLDFILTLPEDMKEAEYLINNFVEKSISNESDALNFSSSFGEILKQEKISKLKMIQISLVLLKSKKKFDVLRLTPGGVKEFIAHYTYLTATEENLSFELSKQVENKNDLELRRLLKVKKELKTYKECFKEFIKIVDSKYEHIDKIEDVNKFNFFLLDTPLERTIKWPITFSSESDKINDKDKKDKNIGELHSNKNHSDENKNDINTNSEQLKIISSNEFKLDSDCIVEDLLKMIHLKNITGKENFINIKYLSQVIERINQSTSILADVDLLLEKFEGSDTKDNEECNTNDNTGEILKNNHSELYNKTNLTNHMNSGEQDDIDIGQVFDDPI